mmetsp:Transcript_16105/g.24516  ORF Transcript_16105/g.24516 Transcript_16105/m.24516 type:complete len:102 (+) Transcript_16105:312-617(+)
MEGWKQDQGVDEDSLLSFMADPYSQVTRALDMELTHEGPRGVGLINRCKRFALYVEDGEVKVVRIAEAEDDPAGDDFPEVTCAPEMLEAIKEVTNSGSEEL